MSTIPAESNPVLRYQPSPRRDVDAVVLSDMGWIEGSFVVPKLNNFVDFLNNSGGYVKLTRASFKGLEQKLPFLALARGAYTLVVPTGTDDRLQAVTQGLAMRTHHVSCIFATGWVSGVMHTLENLRVSDVLTNSKPFFLLRDCTITFNGAVRRAPIAIVNGTKLVGVSEPSIEDVRNQSVASART